ncbi:MAG: histidine kinase dimerization/phospho-acceptor domain-containing protein, partial [Nitrosopumilus sp.]
MKLRTKIILTFSMIFIIAFATLSYNAHTTIESSLLSAGLSDELVASILSEVGISTLILSTIIGIGTILVVFWVSSRIALPLRKLDSQLKSQHVGHLLRNIEIERSSIDKDDEISEVVQIINSMINRLNKLELKTQELLAVITHELKTPLAAILGHAQVLQRPKMMGELNPKQQKAIKIINRNVTELKTMIIDLLDSQKLDLEKMRF